MNIRMTFICGVLMTLALWNTAHAQCNQCTTQNPAAVQTTVALAPTWTTVATDLSGRQFALFAVEKGKYYEWTTCGDADTWNTYMTLRWSSSCTTGSMGGWVADYNNDDPSCADGVKSTIGWHATATGTVALLLTEASLTDTCQANALANMTLKWRYSLPEDCINCTNLYPVTVPAADEKPYWSIVSTNMSGGDFAQFDLIGGTYYEWTTCGDTDFDTQLTLYPNTCAATEEYLAVNNDDPTCSPQSTLTYFSFIDQTVSLLLSKNFCEDTTTDNMTLKWRKITPPLGCVDNRSDLGTIADTSSLTFTDVSTTMLPGDYYRFTVTAGNTYEWTTCGDADFDTQLTLRGASSTTPTVTSPLLSYNDNGGSCGDGSTIQWTATFSGSVLLLLNKYRCSNLGSEQMTLKWRRAATERFVTERYLNKAVDLTGTGNLLVKDTLTKLWWRKNILEKTTWVDALSDCSNETWGGFDDWRVPDINELGSIINYAKNTPATFLPGINTATGFGITNEWLWSSTTVNDSTTYVWTIMLEDGRTYINPKEAISGREFNSRYVPCVRDDVIGVHDKNRRTAGTTTEITGWTCDRSHAAQYNKVELDFVAANGTHIVTKEYGDADEALYTTDVNANCNDGLNHGFSYDLFADTANVGTTGKTVRQFIEEHLLLNPTTSQPFKVYAYGINVGNEAQRTLLYSSPKDLYLYDVCGDGLLDTNLTPAQRTNGENCEDTPPNTVTEKCPCGQTTPCTVCNASCISDAGDVRYCGDGTTDGDCGEACDDGNTVTETCDWQLLPYTCTGHCNATCTVAAGIAQFCGDSVIQAAHETCDRGTALNANTGASGGANTCWTDCTKYNPVGFLTGPNYNWTTGANAVDPITGATCDQDVPLHDTVTLRELLVYDKDSAYLSHFRNFALTTSINNGNYGVLECNGANDFIITPASFAGNWSLTNANGNLLDFLKQHPTKRPFKIIAVAYDNSNPTGTQWQGWVETSVSGGLIALGRSFTPNPDIVGLPSAGDLKAIYWGGRCGDMVIQTDFEQCDDGNTNNCDGCTNSCTTSGANVCGDGCKGVDEQCDNGAANGPSAACLQNVPGDTTHVYDCKNNPCTTGWTLYPTGARCYKYFSAATAFHAAETACVGQTANLVALADAAEGTFVRNSVVAAAGGGNEYWVGLTQEERLNIAAGTQYTGRNYTSWIYSGNTCDDNNTRSSYIDYWGSSTSSITGNDEYINFSPATTGHYNMLLYPRSSWDAAIGIYDADDGTWYVVDGPAAGGTENADDQFSFTFNAGNTYVIMPEGYSGACGEYVLDILKDSVQPTTWFWTNAIPTNTSYTNWDTGQPDNSGGVENCAHVWGGGTAWNDRPCTDALAYVCEKGGALCGNGAVNAGETCDDGNSSSADNCRNDCNPNICGDSIRKTSGTAPLEACDDGNLDSCDLCSSTCTVKAANSCGDGYLCGTELCDDGNTSSNDACKSPSCTYNTCGDGIRVRPSSAALILPLNDGINTKATDYSGNGNHGTVSSASLWTTGKFGKALNFNSENLYIPEHASLKMGKNMTVAAWVKRSSLPASYVSIIHKDGASIRNYGLFIGGADNVAANQGRVLFSFTPAANDWRGGWSTTSIVDGNWHHVAATYDGANVKVYIDGNLESTGAETSTPSDTTGGVYVGAGFGGTIDDVRVYSRAFAGVEIADLANNVLMLHLDENTGTTARDSSGYGNNATLNNGPTWIDGKIAKAINFDGVDDSVSWTYNSGTPSNNFTMMAWVKTSATIDASLAEATSGATMNSAAQNFVFYPNHGGTANGGAGLSVGTNGIAVAEHGDGYAPALAMYSGSLGTGWNHIAVVYTNKQPVIYLNGALVRTGLTSLRTAVTAPTTMGVGWDPFSGQIDEVRIYNRSITASGIATLYASSYPTEMCDDGNTTAGDGCSPTCRVEDNWSCTTTDPATCISCGNGIVEAGEQCDDADFDNNDACKNNCTNNVCGDGYQLIGTETCDTGMSVACSNAAATGHPSAVGTAPCNGTCTGYVSAGNCTKTNTCAAKPQTCETVYNTVSNYPQSWNGSAWSPVDDGTTEYNATGSATACRYACVGTQFAWNSSTCAAQTKNYTCSGLPANAVWSFNNTTSYTYTQTGACSGTTPVWSPADHPTAENNATAVAGECHFKCNLNYTWNGSVCVADTRVQACTGLPATGASWNTASSITQTWSGSAWLPTTVGTYNVNASTAECRFKCNLNYTWNGTDTCVADTRTGQACTGKDPNSVYNTATSISQTWNGTAWAPSTVATYNPTPSTTECRFACNVGYPWDGAACNPCGTGWTYYPGTTHCYKYSGAGTTATQTNAETACVGMQGHLTSIGDAGENTFVNGLMDATSWFGLYDTCVTPPLPSCTHTLKLWDSFGDSWNGNNIDVYVNGSKIADALTVSSGFGPYTYTFTATHGQAIKLDYWYDGSYPSENYVHLYSTAGTILGSDDKAAGAYPYNYPSYIINTTATCPLVAPTRNWYWKDASAFSYNNWNTGEPNNSPSGTCGSQPCGYMYKTTEAWNGKWDDAACTTAMPYVCERGTPSCGNGIVEAGETCDDGNTSNCDTCSSTCQTKAANSCGDGIQCAGEACDDGNANNCDTCSTSCTTKAANTCGDGSLCDAEQCDDGNANNNDACKNNCTLNTCGDGVRNYIAGTDWTNPANWTTWDSSAGATLTWDAANNALKAVGYKNIYLTAKIPVDTTKNYYLKYDVMIKNSAGKLMYAGTHSYDNVGTMLPGHPGSYDYFAEAGTSPATLTPDTWFTNRINTVIAGAARTGESSDTGVYSAWHTGTRSATIMFLLNYAGVSTQETYIRNLRFYEGTEKMVLHLDETSGTTAQDSSGTGITGALTNGPVWTTGKIGNGLFFDGVDDYVLTTLKAQVGNLDAVAGNPWTTSLWFKQTNTTGVIYQALANLSGGVNNGTYALNLYSGSLRASLRGGTNTVIKASPGVSNNAWHHIAITWDGTTAKAYFDNGAPVTIPVGATAIQDKFLTLGAANNGASYRFSGWIDEVLVYNRALTATEIATLYGLAGDTAYEKCDDANGTAGDGCTSCSVDTSWNCTGNAPSACYQCGNAVVDPGEACDAASAVCSTLGVTGSANNAPCKADCSGWQTTGSCTKTYSCTAKPQTDAETMYNTVSSYLQTWNGAAWNNVDDATTEYNTTGSTAACRYKCITTAYWTGASCITSQSVACTGLPTYGAVYGNGTTSQNITQTYDGATWSPATAAYYADGTPDANTCEYRCDTALGYSWNAGLGRCVKCGDGTLEVGLEECETGNTLACASLSPTINATSGTATCSASCTWVKTSCAKTNTCPSLPDTCKTQFNNVSSYGQLYNGAGPSWNPVDDAVTDYNASPADPSKSCQYICRTPHFTWNSSSCAAATNTFTCSGLPANSVWTYTSTATHTYNRTGTCSGSTPVWDYPDTSATYSTTPNQYVCNYKCATGYLWDGANCILNPCGNGNYESGLESCDTVWDTWAYGAKNITCETYNPIYYNNINLACQAGCSGYATVANCQRCGDSVVNNDHILYANDAVAYFRLNDGTGTTAVNSGSGASNASLNSGPSWINGKFNKALSFDGVDDSLTWSYTTRPTNTFTMMAWVKTSSTRYIETESTSSTGGTNATNHYVFWPENLDTTSGAGFSVGTDGISVYEHANSYMPALAVYNTSLGTGWNHVAVVYNAKTPSIYLNGTLVRTGLTSPQTTVSAPTAAGVSAGYYGTFAGQIDDIRVFNRALTNKELRNYITGPVMALHMNESSGAIAVDASGFSNNGTIGGSAAFTTSGKRGNALSFDGVDDSVTIPDHGSLQVSAYTVSAWIFPTAFMQEWTGIIGKPGRDYHIWLHNSGFIHHRFHDTASTSSGCPDTAAGLIPLNTWSHVAITNDGTTCKTYVNGIERTTGSVTGSLVVDPGTTYIGTGLDGGGGAWFKGTIDEVRIYNRALSSTEIASNAIEDCDDGNTTNGDGCSSTCAAETRTGQACTGLPTANASWNSATSITQAWNGAGWSPTTAGTYNTTASTTECRFQCASGYTYYSATNQCMKCGNGVKEGSEVCDDGNTAAGDYCNATCAAATAPTNKVLATYLGDINYSAWVPSTGAAICPGSTAVVSKVCAVGTYNYNIDAKRAFVYFDSDNTVTGSGFTVSSGSTTLISQGTYGNDTELLWVLDSVNNIGTISLTINGMENCSSCGCDYVRIYKCSSFGHGTVPSTCNLENRYQSNPSGSTTLPATISYPTNRIRTRFISDASTVYDGFKFTANGTSYQTSPFNDYSNSLDQYLDITTTTSPTQVIFQNFQTEWGGYGSSDYSGDYMFLYSCPLQQ